MGILHLNKNIKLFLCIYTQTHFNQIHFNQNNSKNNQPLKKIIINSSCSSDDTNFLYQSNEVYD